MLRLLCTAISAAVDRALRYPESIESKRAVPAITRRCSVFSLFRLSSRSGIAGLQRRSELASDTVLGIFAHVALALGAVVVAFMETLWLDLLAYLFGDLLAVGRLDLLWVYLEGAASLAVLVGIWRPLLAVTVHEDLAAAEGISVERTRLLCTLLVAVIAIAMKIVGILLIISLLIILAAAARNISRSPERMAIVAVLFGIISVAGGLGVSLQWDTPSGPSIVLAAFVIFVLARLGKQPKPIFGS